MEANERTKPGDAQQSLNRVRGLVDLPVVQSGRMRPHMFVERRPFSLRDKADLDARFEEFGRIRSGALGEITEPVN